MSKSKKQYIEDAISYYKAQRYHEALAAFEQAIQIDPNCVKALHGRGVIFAGMERYKEAIESYEQASKLALDVAKIHLDMAEAFYALHDYEKSGSSYREAIRLDSMNEAIYRDKEWELTNKAIHYFHQWLINEAYTAFQQVLLFSPENTQAPHYLSRLLDNAPLAKRFVGNDRDNNQWDFSSSIHPANCRCSQCWEP